MVCSFGSGKMAALSRLLEAGNSLYQISEEVSHNKLIAQYISRELAEADEENLLDEEDMYVFDWKPMVDTLHLVHCNTCKKPIKASQFAVHADLCKLLSLKDGSFVKVDGTKPKKPPKKERKKSVRSPAIVNTVNGALNTPETAETRTRAAESHLDDQFGMASSPTIEEKINSSPNQMIICLPVFCLPCLNTSETNILHEMFFAENDINITLLKILCSITSKTEYFMIFSCGTAPYLFVFPYLLIYGPSHSSLFALGNSTSVDMTVKLSTSGVRGYKVHSPGVVPLAKRPKMISPAQLLLSDDPETVLDTRNGGSHDAGKDLQDGVLAAINTPYSFEHQMSRQVNGCCVLARDAPAPLASKIYYSQRNLRLRSAFRIMYDESLTDNNMSSSNGLQELVKLPHITSSTCLSDERVNVQPDMKVPNQFLSSGGMPDQNIARSSKACLNKREELSPAGFSSQVLHTNHRSRSRTASVGIPINQYLSQSHSFASNSGTIQQPNGSVPVI